jgi:hypothetical protein
MIAEYQRTANIGIGSGILVQIIARLLMAAGDAGALLGLPLALLGTGLFIWGCWAYAEGKGHHGGWGLLGLFSLIGLVILVLMPDKCRGESRRAA